MITLYSGIGSAGFELVGVVSDAGSFQNLRRHATALLNARGATRAAELLWLFPFELWTASNNFNDEFSVLFAKLSLNAYEKARLQKESKEDRSAYAKIAAVFSEMGTYVRFISVSLDTSRAPGGQRGMKESQIKRLVYRYIGVTGGYLGDFSYRTHADFYTDLDLDIDPYRYQGTTRERFTQILTESPADVQATILDGVLVKYPVGSSERRTQQLADEIRGWAHALRAGPAVPDPRPNDAPETVRRALADADHLLKANGPISAVDRVHTALHGYQLGLCAKCGIAVPDDASLTQIFKQLRKSHPSLQSTGHRAQDIEKILNAFNSILDALNPIRNRASVAHPNPVLLDETDARLVINASRTIFHYLEAKVSASPTPTATDQPISDDDVPF